MKNLNQFTELLTKEMQNVRGGSVYIVSQFLMNDSQGTYIHVVWSDGSWADLPVNWYA